MHFILEHTLHTNALNKKMYVPMICVSWPFIPANDLVAKTNHSIT